jgi:hypothetical protein
MQGGNIANHRGERRVILTGHVEPLGVLVQKGARASARLVR